MVPREVEEIWDKYNLHPGIRKHCMTVARLAVDIADKIKKNGHKVDKKLVELGALLHDIGRAITNDPFQHFIKSAYIIRQEGLDERIAKVAERHFSAGLDQEDAKKLGLPPKNYIPETLEEKIVSFSDNLVFDSEIKTFNDFMKRLEEIDRVNPTLKWLTEKTRVRALKMKEELESLSGMKF